MLWYRERRSYYGVATFTGLTYEKSDSLCYFSFDDFDDVIFRMSYTEYLSIVDGICDSLKRGICIFELNNHLGLSEDYNYEEEDWDLHLEFLNKIFDRIKFKVIN